MAFQPNNLVRWAPTFPSNANDYTIPTQLTPMPLLPQQWAYQAGSDTIQMVQAAGYFVYFANFVNTAIYNNGNFLQVGDQIYCVCSNGNVNLTVTATTPQIITSSIASPQVASVSLTSAQFEAAYGAPVLLIPTPGANRLITIINWTVAMTFVTTQYAAGGALGLQYGNTVHGGGTAASSTIAAATINGWTVSSAITAQGALASTAFTACVNEGVYLSTPTAFTTGDGTFVINAAYYETLI